MAEQFGHPQKEILRALKFWEKSGLLSLQCDRAGRLISIHLCEVRPRVIVRDPETDDAGRVVSIEPLLSDTAFPKRQSRRSAKRKIIRLSYTLRKSISAKHFPSGNLSLSAIFPTTCTSRLI